MIPSKQMAEPPAGLPCHRIKVHGGLGDALWLFRKLFTLDKPLFIHVSNENQARPRRMGPLLDHLPQVCGWKYDDTSFIPGADWPDSSHPACAVGRRWSEIEPAEGQVLTLECNKWLEMGRRLEDWLPDLDTVWHFPLTEPDPPTRRWDDHPYVIAHISGWNDVPDTAWVQLINHFRDDVQVYIIAGSYDGRPTWFYPKVKGKGVTLALDLAWSDLYYSLRNCLFVFGHASGFTTVADLLKVRGAVYNPASLPKLVGTWNSPANPGLVHVNKVDSFLAAVWAAGNTINRAGVWPPASIRAKAVTSAPGDPGTAFAALAKARVPSTMLLAPPPDNPRAAGAAVNAAYDAGAGVRAVAVVGNPDAAKDVERTAARCSKRPLVVHYPTLSDLPSFATFELVAAYVPGHGAAGVGDTLWGRTTAAGLLAFGGPGAATVRQDLDGRTGGKLQTFCDDWYYVYRGA